MSDMVGKEQKHSENYYPRQVLSFADIKSNHGRGVFDLDSGQIMEALFPGETSLKEFITKIYKSPQGVLQISFMDKKRKKDYAIKKYKVSVKEESERLHIHSDQEEDYVFPIGASLRFLYEELKILAEKEKLDFIFLDFSQYMLTLRVQQIHQQLIHYPHSLIVFYKDLELSQ